MSPAKRYCPARSKYFEGDYVRLVRKNQSLCEQIDNKIRQVLGCPEVYKNLKRPLSAYKRVHIGPFVMTFRIDGDFVRFVRIDHHDKIYKLPHD
jgi:mRNA-degrading endonuclease RelE of RelBE toxin-antitoxin system